MFHFPKTILGLEDLPSKMNALYLGENYNTTMLTKKNTVSGRKEKFLVSIGGVKIEAEKIGVSSLWFASKISIVL